MRYGYWLRDFVVRYAGRPIAEQAGGQNACAFNKVSLRLLTKVPTKVRCV